MNRWLNLAHKLTIDSDHSDQKMGAVIVRGGAVLSKAANRQRWGSHAEIRALSKIGYEAHGATVYVVRENRRTSRPCPMCHLELKRAGVRSVVYLDYNGNPIKERI